MAYFTLEPFGDDWLRTAVLASVIANANRDAKVRPEPFKPEDFMPHVNRDVVDEQRPTDWRETKKRFLALVKR